MIHIHISPKLSVAKPPMWRVLHDIELPGGVRDVVKQRNVPLPEVQPLFPRGSYPLNEKWQRMFKDLNPALPPMKWRALLGWTVAFTNENGYDEPGDPRADYINGQGIDKPLPRLWSLLCGGATITGRVEGAWFYIDTLDGWADPPPAQWVLDHPEYWFRAVSVNPKGEINNLPQGGGDLVKRVPIVSRYPVKIEMSKLVKL